jgi:hypothetical protein
LFTPGGPVRQASSAPAARSSSSRYEAAEATIPGAPAHLHADLAVVHEEVVADAHRPVCEPVFDDGSTREKRGGVRQKALAPIPVDAVE